MRRENEDFIQFVGTNNSARDMDTIRRALGEDEISFFGFSYGSELGGTWATLFPKPCGPPFSTAPSTPLPTGSKNMQQTAGFEARCRRSSPSAATTRLPVPQRR